MAMMRRRFQFDLKALLLLTAVAAIYSFIAYMIRESYSPNVTEADRRYLARERERLERDRWQQDGRRD